MTEPGTFAINAMLCDSAVVAEGKLYIQGGAWNILTTLGTFPFRQPRIGLGVVITVPYTATNQNHRLKIGLVNEDGEPIPLGSAPPGAKGAAGAVATNIQANFNMGRPPQLQHGDAQVVPVALNLDGLEFPAPGNYAAVLSIDDTEIERLTFRVMSAQPNPMAA